MPMTQRQIIKLQIIGGVTRDEMIVGRQVIPRFEAAMGDADADTAIGLRHLRNPGRRIVHRSLAQHGAREKRHAGSNCNRRRLGKQMQAATALSPWRPVPNAAHRKGIVIAR